MSSLSSQQSCTRQPVSFRKTALQIVPKSARFAAVAEKRAPLVPLQAASSQAASSQAAPAESASIHAIEVPLCELSNGELVLRCQSQLKKDRAAFEELVSRYQRYVDKLLYHLASDWSDRADLAQEVWIRVSDRSKIGA